MIAIIPVLLISVIFKSDLETLLDVTGGVTGVNLLLLIPSLMIIKSRILQKKKFGNNIKFIHKSSFSQSFWPYSFFLLSLVCLGYVIYIQINKYS